MPIYEYRRPDGTTFEVVQAFSDDSLTVDPETGVPVERVLHPPAVHFKGKGFYNTDYGTRKRNRETLAAAEGTSSDKDSGSEKAPAAGASDGGASSAPSTDSATAGKGDSEGSKGGSATAGKDGGAGAKKTPSGRRSKRARAR